MNRILNRKELQSLLEELETHYSNVTVLSIMFKDDPKHPLHALSINLKEKVESLRESLEVEISPRFIHMMDDIKNTVIKFSED